MLEVLLCSLITVLPDYLFRKYKQDKSWGKEITFFTMWYELRWGITACAMLSISLVTLIFFYHPSTNNATPMFRTITLLPEEGGRVQHVYVKNDEKVKAGTALFSLYDESQMSNIDQAEVKIREIEAEFSTAQANLAAAQSGVVKAQRSVTRSNNEYQRKKTLQLKGQNLISESEVQRLGDTVNIHKADLAKAKANEVQAQAQIDTILPARKASAEEALNSAKIEEGKRTVYAHVDGQLKQFFLQPGDYVNPILRPAGILVPSHGEASGRQGIHAGFNQLTANVITVGTYGEVTCLSKPFTIIPMKVTRVQDIIASGQIRVNETLLDLRERAKPGSIAVWMEPIYEGGMDGVLPGTKCIANTYSYHHELITSGKLGIAKKVFLHMVDTIGIVHALILRIQALILPVKILVFSGH